MLEHPQQNNPPFNHLFEDQQSELLAASQNQKQITLARASLQSKVEYYKQLLLFKEKLLQRSKTLKSRGKQLQHQAKYLSDSEKKQHPIFIVRPSFVAERFIKKEIKSSVLQLGKKFNSLNHFQKNDLLAHLVMHKQNSQLVKEYTKLFKTSWKVEKDRFKKASDQRYKILQNKLSIQTIQKYHQKLKNQMDSLIQSRKHQKLTYDQLKKQVNGMEGLTNNIQVLLEQQKQKYLKDFNVAICRERLHNQLQYDLKERKLTQILNQSCKDVEFQEKVNYRLSSTLRKKEVPYMFGRIASYSRRQQRAVSPNVSEYKKHQKRLTAKTEHSESTALRTKCSYLQ